MAERKYELDWIRVIVFDILIIYHVGMFFVPWDWELKNNETIEWLEWPMVFINRWRLPILFLISGMGTKFAMSKRNGWQFVFERWRRLFWPLLIGILVVVPPQVYLVRLSQGYAYSSFWQFYPDFFSGIYPQGNFSWGHLWFLPYLLLMSLVSTPLFTYFRKNDAIMGKFAKLVKKKPVVLYLFVVPLFLVEVFLEPYYPINHALIGDWYALAHYYLFFLFGYLMASVNQEVWGAIRKLRFYTLGIGMIAFPVLLWMWDNYLSIFWIPLIASLNIWSWILVILGFGSIFLNKNSRLLKYRNRAVYPFYILHQTITLILGYYLMNSPISLGLKAIIMIFGTFGGCWLLYELLIRRIFFLRPLFGVK